MRSCGSPRLKVRLRHARWHVDWALALHARNVAYSDAGTQEWIFAEVFEIAAIDRLAVNIHAGAEHEVYAAGACVLADSRANSFGKSRIPRSGQSDPGRVDRGRKAGVGAHSDGTVGHFERGKVEPGHGANGEAGAADVVDLLFQRHLLNQRGSFLMGGVGRLCEELDGNE